MEKRYRISFPFSLPPLFPFLTHSLHTLALAHAKICVLHVVETTWVLQTFLCNVKVEK